MTPTTTRWYRRLLPWLAGLLLGAAIALCTLLGRRQLTARLLEAQQRRDDAALARRLEDTRAVEQGQLGQARAEAQRAEALALTRHAEALGLIEDRSDATAERLLRDPKHVPGALVDSLEAANDQLRD